MIDIHTHILPFVDDGSKSLEESIEMLKQAKENNVTDIVCTPHFRLGRIMPTDEEIDDSFALLKPEAEKLGITLHLGREIAWNKGVLEMIKHGELKPIDDTKYILIEFRYNDYVDIPGIVYDLSCYGFKPIVAHIERYEYIDADVVDEIKQNGGLIQVNASSLVLNESDSYKMRATNYIKYCLVDIIASDIHAFRSYCLKDCYNYVLKKFGKNAAEVLFEKTGKKILGLQ